MLSATLRRAFLCTTASVSLAGQSLAELVSRPVGIRVTQGDWVLVPVIYEDTNLVAVTGVLALRNKAGAAGDNLVSVWYENPNASEAEWPAKAWTSMDQWEAIKWVKESFGIDDKWDFLWPTSDPKTLGASSEAPQTYYKGLLESDPFAALTSDPSNEQIIDALTTLGYQSASIKVDKNGPCDTKNILPVLSDTVAYAVAARPPVAAVQARYAALVPVACQAPPPPPPPPPPPLVPGTTTPQPGVPLNPVGPWQTGPRPDRLVPSCSTATTCCYGQQIIWLYTTTNWLGLTVIEYCESEITWSCPAPAGTPPAPCPPAPTCSGPSGPPAPPPPAGPVPCGNSYY